jgi:hypothetical protein
VLTVLAKGRQFVEGELVVRDDLTPQDLASCLDELTQWLTLPLAALIHQRPNPAALTYLLRVRLEPSSAVQIGPLAWPPTAEPSTVIQGDPGALLVLDVPAGTPFRNESGQAIPTPSRSAGARSGLSSAPDAS